VKVADLLRVPRVVQKDALFPRYAIDYFRQLRLQYELLVERNNVVPPPSVTALFARVDADASKTTWADVFFLETAYLYALPDDRLAAELAIFRYRYQQVADPAEIAAYVSTSLRDLSKAQPSDVRAELLAVAERIRYLYTFVPPKEAMRNKLSRDAAILTLMLVLAAIGIVLYGATHDLPTPPVFIVAFGGILGGFLSVQQRLQRQTDIDPLFKELQLSAGWFGVVFLAPISGGVFAIVLYWIFLARLIESPLVPNFGPVHPAAGPIDFFEFVKQSGPRDASDYGKTLVWSFIAGFAERFVPDVLTRLSQQVSSSIKVVAIPTGGTDATSLDQHGAPAPAPEAEPHPAADES
jgi:hypothetical protein